MKVLFLTIGAVSNLKNSGAYTDLLRRFADQKHEVYVVGSLEKRTGMDTYKTVECGVNVLRVRIGNITKTGLIEKGISTLKVAGQYQKAIEDHFGDIRFDLILYTTPPITLATLVSKFKKKHNAFTYLLLKDIFPQNAVDLGMLSKNGIKGLIYCYFKQVEKKLYAVSDMIGCMSQANIDFLKKHNPEIPHSKIEECPNTIDLLENVPSKDRKRIKELYGIPEDKYLLVYGGNFGRPQNVDYIVESLKACGDMDNIHFVMCGSGTDFYKLDNYYKENKPKNLSIIQFLPYDEYAQLVSSCDAGLLFLDYRFTIPNFPSRLLDYMNYGLPVIAATDCNTDVGKVIEDNGFGWWCESRDPECYRSLLQSIFERKDVAEKLFEKSLAARKCLEKLYTTDRAYRTILEAASAGTAGAERTNVNE